MEASADPPAVPPRVRGKELLLLLAATVFALLACSAAIRWVNGTEREKDEQKRIAERKNAEAVTALLDTCEDALTRKDLRAAVAALDAAVKLFNQGGAAQHERRIQTAWDQVNRACDSLKALVDMGNAATDRNDLPGAVAAYREAVGMDSTDAFLRTTLATVLMDDGQLDDALLVAREAVQLEPSSADAHTVLGYILMVQDDRNQAVIAFREAVRLDPNHFYAQANLGGVLTNLGDFDGAVIALKVAVRVTPATEPHTDEELDHAERLRDLRPILPALLAGGVEPDSPTQAADYAVLCSVTKSANHTFVANLFAMAFDGDAKLMDDQATMYRYRAASAAALGGRGAEGDDLSRTERKSLRDQARVWLRGELAVWSKLARSRTAADRRRGAENLRSLLRDADFAGTRPGPLRIGMTVAERADWDAFWSDVKELLAEARKPLER